MPAQKIVTRDSIQSMINQAIVAGDNAKLTAIVGRALVVLFRNQTADEQRVNETSEDNGIGFTGADAYSGTLTAKSYLKHKKLQDWQLDKWTKRSASTGYSRIAKYHSQLNQAALDRLK